MLNKNRMKNAPFAIGYRAEIYLGEWPIAYHSQNTNVNWYYQKVNINYMDNQSEQKVVCMSYEQEANKEVRGGVTTQLQRMEDVQRMIEVQARKKTGLPLSFYTVVGAGTKGRGLYHVPAKHLGYLTAYVPAIHEEGEGLFTAQWQSTSSLFEGDKPKKSQCMDSNRKSYCVWFRLP